MVLSVGCTNRGSTAIIAKGGGSNTLNSITGSGSGGGATPTSAITLSSVLRSQADPNGKLDLIGDGSGAIQTFCNPEGKAPEESLCQCVLGYIDGSGNSLQLGVVPSHIESDLIRCSYTGVPSTVTQLTVKIYFTPADLSSNTYNFNFSTAIGGASLSDLAAYIKPTRFQCKSHVYISHFGDSSDGGSGGASSSPTLMYDPIQSEDPRLAYGFNYYTNNPGGAVALYASQNASQQRLWECPLDLTNGSPLGLDYSVYSLASDGQSSRIYPAAGSAFDRSTFLTSRTKNGIFNVAINAPLMPGLANQIPDAQGNVGKGVAPVLGWGVQPSPAANNENCPGANVAIPAGHHWAKLWLFRGSLAIRYAKSSPNLSFTPIACNPGIWDSSAGAGADKPLVSDCADSSGTNTNADCGGGPNGTKCIGMNYNFTAGSLVDRILMRKENGVIRSRCVKLTQLGQADSTIAAGQTSSSTALFPGYTQYGLGTDIWSPRHHAAGNPAVTGNPNECTQLQKFDPLNLCSVPDHTKPKGENPASTSYVPHVSDGTNEKLSDIAIDTSDGNGFSSRSDYLFVVTPATVSAAQMDAQGSSVANMYTPYRFIPSTACQSGNPDNPAFQGDCDPRYKVPYHLERHDITQAGSTSSNFIYPVCVLQPD